MKNKTFKILTILGSPHDAKSNTRAFVEDFVDEIAQAGLPLEHEVVSLGSKNVKPCIGCWSCTRGRSCPLKDDLAEIKKSMIKCDMLILASPVYTNQVTAQMKAFCDRLFTWCHIFPLLGKYGLSVATTGNDGHKETGSFLEKMLATYGVRSFGSILSPGGFTPGFFPWREESRKKFRKLAQKVAQTVLQGKMPRVRSIQRKMFRMMKLKMSGIHTVNSMVYGVPENQPRPLMLRVKIMEYLIKRTNLSEAQFKKWASMLSFELSWWRDRGWLRANSFKQLAKISIADGFYIEERLLGGIKMKVEELKMYGAALEMPREAVKKQNKIMLTAIKQKFGVFGMIGVFKDTVFNQIRLKKNNPDTQKKAAAISETIEKEMFAFSSMFLAIAKRLGREEAYEFFNKEVMDKMAKISMPAIYQLNDLKRCEGDVFENFKKMNIGLFERTTKDRTWNMESYTNEEDKLTIKITSCANVELFGELGVPELGKFGCDHDLAGYAAIGDDVQCEFRRLCTIAKGDDHCLFEFYRKGTAPNNAHLNK